MKFVVLLGGVFFLTFGLTAYRHFYTVLGATAGLAVWVALSDTLVRLPGLRENPGIASVLILCLLFLAGVYLARRFRRLLVFSGGLGTGVILSQTLSHLMAEGALAPAAIRLNRLDTLDVLAGLIGGIVFLLFERLFAVLLTSVVGSFLCTWAVGGRWVFAAFLATGLVAQPLVFTRFKPRSPPGAPRNRTGSTTLMAFLLIFLVPAQITADGSVMAIHLRAATAPSEVVVRNQCHEEGVGPGISPGRLDAGREDRRMVYIR